MSTMTMQDIADLASVSRQAVSMWRKRPTVRGKSMPFPEPVGRVDGVERFDRDTIVDWLRRTGRGNTPAQEAEYDAPAHAAADDLELEDAIALLCLVARTDFRLADTSREDRIAAARNIDPDDEFLLGEIEQLTPSSETLEYIDATIDSCFGPADALRRLESGRLGRNAARRDLSEDGVLALVTIIRAVAAYLDPDNVVLASVGDPTPVLTALDHNGRLFADETGPGRPALRRAWIRGIHTSDDSRKPRITAVTVLGYQDHEALEAIDETLLNLADGDVALIAGSARLLVDALDDADLRARRADSLRLGNLVAALRLPRGLWRFAHRQPLGLWVCRGGAEATHIRVGDVPRMIAAQCGDLGADVVAALAMSNQRSYRFLRPVEESRLLAAGALVPRGVAPVRLQPRTTRDHLDRVQLATQATRHAVQPVDALVTPAADGLILQQRSLGELSAEGMLKVFRRSRISQEHADPRGTVRVLPDDAFRLDPVDAEQIYPAATRTEPWDVIFTEKPQPRAWIDKRGGALVAHPAYILRLTSSAVTPHLIAAVINHLSGDSTEWKTWQIPIMSAEALESLTRKLIEIDNYQRELEKRTQASVQLAQTLIEGIAAGAIDLYDESAT